MPAGQIAVKWDIPSDNGGTPVIGYVLFLDGIVYYNSSDVNSSLSEYTFTSLTVGRTYTIEIAARNRKGDGANASLSLLAASLPPKLPMPDFHSATHLSIMLNASKPTYTGGSPITAFAYRRDNGPLTTFSLP